MFDYATPPCLASTPAHNDHKGSSADQEELSITADHKVLSITIDRTHYVQGIIVGSNMYMRIDLDLFRQLNNTGRRRFEIIRDLLDLCDDKLNVYTLYFIVDKKASRSDLVEFLRYLKITSDAQVVSPSSDHCGEILSQIDNYNDMVIACDI